MCKLIMRSQTHVGVVAFFLENLANLFFVHGLACKVEFQFVFAASHAEDLETIDFRDEFGCTGRHLFRVALHCQNRLAYLEENMRKTIAKVCPVDVKLSLPRYIHVLTLGAVYLDSRSR